MSSIRRRLRRLLPLAAVIALLPLAGDATNDAACCNVAASFATSYFGGGNGDEDFFTVPAGPPNLMILLSNSSSMLDFPNPVPFPGSTLTTATWNATTSDNWTALDPTVCKALSLPANCTYTPATTYLNSQTRTTIALSATQPYDNGNSSATALVTDHPSWAIGTWSNACTPRTTTAGAGTNACLFSPASFYFYRSTSSTDLTGLLGTGGLGDTAASWSTAGALEYPDINAVCALTRIPSAANCRTALTTKGYYLFKDQRVNGANQPRAAFFAGWFLNVYPPKFVIARKIVKTVASVDANVDSPMDNVRLGLTVLRQKANGSGNPGSRYTNTDGGQLVVPLGPSCDVYPVRQPDLVEPRQAIVDAINDPSQVPFWSTSNNNPINNQLAETLYNVGQYYSSFPRSGDPYTTLFGSSWLAPSNEWSETAAGTVNAPWAASGSNQHSFCWACQQSSVVIVTDGDPKYDNNLPQSGVATSHSSLVTGSPALGDFRSWSNPQLTCSPSCGTDVGNGASNLLHKVAFFLANNDLRNETGMAGIQTVRTYTISFGITSTSHPTASALLEKTALLGGGTFNNSESDADLEAALTDAANDVLVRATSFSVSNTAPLQTSQNTQLFLARFKPAQSPAWEGHLYRFNLWNEFAQGCDATKGPSVVSTGQTAATCKKSDGTSVPLNPNLNGDADATGKAVCTSVWIVDADCEPVFEDAAGNFVKGEFNSSHVLVAQTTRGGVSCSTDPAACNAKPFWDAGQVLSTTTATGYRTAAESPAATARTIYTLIDSDDDGKLTSADRRIELKTSLLTSAPADWLKLRKALNVNATFCQKLFEKMGVYGIAGWDPATTAGLDLCAKQVIHFVRGWDVLDEDSDGCGGPGFPTNSTFCPVGAGGTRADGEERNRAADGRDSTTQTFWKFGDVFHSSPALVNPPASEVICDLALDPQCVSTLHGAQGLSGAVQTPLLQYTLTSGGTTTTIDAYDQYRRDHASRRRLVVVGANDGMLHAFDAGSPDTTSPVDALGNRPYTTGNGEERWAFVPPDLLPKLQNMIIDGHQYYVDGNTMVRDVWADGTATASSVPNGRKEKEEFHTIAILSERSGGNEYVALDVTDPDDPKFRWMYPQPCTLDVSRMGQSWTGFAPRPPPIGPVKLAVPVGSAKDPLGRGFEERWIVMVNGGYDASLTRGRGVWMMDAWTGAKVWKWENEDFAGFNSQGGMWPVPGGAALLDVGALDQSRIDSDGFFDTATWGDMSGQIFVARFDSPDPSTWVAARAFEEQRQDDNRLIITNRSEFYYMPANTVDPATGYLHTYIGSGNRERLLASGASCGPDNLLGCIQAGCMTDVHLTYDYGSCSYVVRAHTNNGAIQQELVSNTCTDDITCSSVDISFNADVNCNGWRPIGGNYTAEVTCDAVGNCTTRTRVQKGNTAPATRLTNPSIHNRFYGIYTYGGQRIFHDLATAQAFDADRFTDVTRTADCTGTAGTSCTLVNTTTSVVNAAGLVTSGSAATGYDPGWFYEYGHHSSCPLATACDSTDWTDEKTGSGAIILAGCVDWNTFRPRGSATSAISPCNLNAGTARNYTYLADYLSGVPSPTCGMGVSGGAIARAVTRTTNVPPLDPTALVSLGTNSEVRYSVTQIEPGSPPQATQVGTATESNQSMYWLEVPRDLHACRHGDATQCE